MLVTVESRGVIAVLQKASKLNQLVLRNKHLDAAFYREGHDNNFDVVIFCEKYVKLEHQEELHNKSKLPLKFVFVDSQLRGSEKRYLHQTKNATSLNFMRKLCPSNGGSNYFSFGYKAMCQFWFTDFQQYVEDYDWLLRVDDDCHLLPLEKKHEAHLSSLFPLPDHVPFASTKWVPAQLCREDATVTGLLQFSQEVVSTHPSFSPSNSLGAPRNLSSYLYFVPEHTRRPSCVVLSPYTNVFYINLKWLRNESNRIIHTYMEQVKDTGCIFNNRWGDLELWGIMHLLLENPVHHILPLPYLHGSHKCICDPYTLSSHKGNPCVMSQGKADRMFANASIVPSYEMLSVPS